MGGVFAQKPPGERSGLPRSHGLCPSTMILGGGDGPGGKWINAATARHGPAYKSDSLSNRARRTLGSMRLRAWLWRPPRVRPLRSLRDRSTDHFVCVTSRTTNSTFFLSTEKITPSRYSELASSSEASSMATRFMLCGVALSRNLSHP